MNNIKPRVKPNVLIVDDDDASLYLLETVLEELDVNLILAQTGLEALSKIEDREIAIALLDINMPEMEGTELAEILQNDKSRGKVPIIFITASAKDEFELEKFYKSGVVDIILKPFRKNILLGKVNVFLELYRQKQQIIDDHLKLEKLRHDKALLSEVENISHIGSWQQIPKTNKVYWSDEMYKIYGMDKTVPEKNLWDVFVQAIHPDDKEKVGNVLSRTIRDNLFRVMDYRIVRTDGSVRWVHAHGGQNMMTQVG